MTIEDVDIFLNSYIEGNFDVYHGKEKDIRVNYFMSEIQKKGYLEYFLNKIDSINPNLYVYFSQFIFIYNKLLLIRYIILDDEKINKYLLEEVSLYINGFSEIYDDYCKDEKYKDQLIDILKHEFFKEKGIYEGNFHSKGIHDLNKMENVEEDDINEFISNNNLDIFTFYMRYSKQISSNVRHKVIEMIQYSYMNSGFYSKKEFFYNFVKSIINNMQILYPNIQKEKLITILDLFDSYIMKANIIFDIFFNNIDIDNFDNQLVNINLKINKEFQIFYNEKIPNNFRLFELFKYSEVKDVNNYFLHKDGGFEEKRLKINRDLFEILLESNNKKMNNFLNILYNGDLAFEAMQSNIENETLNDEIIVEYRNMLNLLLLLIGKEKIFETENIYNDLMNIRNSLGLNINESLSDSLLKKYLDFIGFKIEIKEDSLVKSLIHYISQQRIISTNNNCKSFEFQDGDIIRGTDIKYLQDILDNGIRAREFYLTNNPCTDLTPLAADFSKISQEEINDRSFNEIIESTYSQLYEMWLVIKKEDYIDKSYYLDSCDRKPLVNLETGIGSTKIRAIILKQLTEEIKVILAKNDFFIPVLDYYTGKVIFSYEDYEFIRNNFKYQEDLISENNVSNLKSK